MRDIDFKGLKNEGEDHIFQSFQNKDKVFITKISDCELHILSIQFFKLIYKLCYF